MSEVEPPATREVTEIVGKYVAEFCFRITADARVTEEWVRETCAREVENVIAILRERAPQVLIEPSRRVSPQCPTLPSATAPTSGWRTSGSRSSGCGKQDQAP